MSKILWKGSVLTSPLPPVMVTCMGKDEKPNIVTVAWTGILSSHPPKTYISLRPERYSHEILRENGEFVINLTTKALVRAADLCGMKTGRKIDKFTVCKLTPEYRDGFSVPAIAEAPLSLDCRVTDVIPLGSHDMFMADIVSVRVDEALLDGEGKLCLDRAALCAYSHGEYFALGERLGKFGFSVAKKKKK